MLGGEALVSIRMAAHGLTRSAGEGTGSAKRSATSPAGSTLSMRCSPSQITIDPKSLDRTSFIVPALVPRLSEGVTRIDVVVHIRQQQLQAQPSRAVSEPEDFGKVIGYFS